MSIFECSTKMTRQEFIQEYIDHYKDAQIETGLISDGYHTFDELYFHRMMLFKVVCHVFKDRAWKSKLHDDGTMYKNYFIAGITTPDGDYSYHYHMEYWEHFKDIKELSEAPKWDGHKPSDIERLMSLLK